MYSCISFIFMCICVYIYCSSLLLLVIISHFNVKLSFSFFLLSVLYHNHLLHFHHCLHPCPYSCVCYLNDVSVFISVLLSASSHIVIKFDRVRLIPHKAYNCNSKTLGGSIFYYLLHINLISLTCLKSVFHHHHIINCLLLFLPYCFMKS